MEALIQKPNQIYLNWPFKTINAERLTIHWFSYSGWETFSYSFIFWLSRLIFYYCKKQQPPKISLTNWIVRFKLIGLLQTQYTTVGLAYTVRCIVNSLVSHDLNVKYGIKYFIRQTFSFFMIQPKICVNPGYKGSMLHTLAAGALP